MSPPSDPISIGTFDRLVASMSRAIAERTTRRAALAKLGRYGVAVTLGAAGGSLLEAESAFASEPGCGGCSPYGGSGCSKGKCGCDSRWCDLGGDCPGGTCRCGSWFGGCYCSNNARLMYGDCCNDCGGGQDCSCSSSFTCNGGPCYENDPNGCSPAKSDGASMSVSLRSALVSAP